MNEQHNELDPRTLFIIIIVLGCSMMLLNEKYYWILFGVTTIIYTIYNGKKVVKYLIFTAITYCITYLVYNVFPVQAIRTFGMFAFIMMRFAPITMVASMLWEYPTGYVLEAMRKMKIPNSLRISLTVAIRFLPDVWQQLSEIKNAAKVRSLKLSILTPVKTFEYIMIPLLHKSLKVADEMSAAIVTKGIEYDGIKTSYHLAEMRKNDIITVAVYVALLGVGICMK